jgi:hypothetical protein
VNKQEFITRLQMFALDEGRGLPDEYGHPDYAPGRGETMLASMFANWLSASACPDEESGLVWARDIPQLIVEAYADFAYSPEWSAARRAYRIRTDHDIPDLVDVYAGGLHRSMVAHSVCRLMPLLAEAPWLRSMLESKLGAQMEVIDHAWRRFVKIAYRKLMPRIKAESHRGNSGRFGATTLVTYAMAGRVMFTFQRPSGSMTYVADDSDPWGNRSGPNSPGAPYAECVAMIEDVVANWDADKLKPSKTAGIG